MYPVTIHHGGFSSKNLTGIRRNLEEKHSHVGLNAAAEHSRCVNVPLVW